MGTYVALAPSGQTIRVTSTENYQRSNGNRISLKAVFTKPGYVIFNDSYAPGWHAWVDGNPRPVFRADGLFMAVPLSENGLHQIDFRYEPTSFRLGLFLTMLSLCFFLFAAAPKGTNEKSFF